MYLSVLLFPLFSALSLLTFGRFLGKNGSAFLSLLLVLFSALVSYLIFFEISFSQTKCVVFFAPWLNVGALDFDWAFFFDPITSVMLVVVTTISFLVHFYSLSYMSEDPHLIRFLAYLSIFTFFMLLLVTSENLALLFFGWEGVGIASYLLINFWYTRIQANKAALKAIVLNRFGDIALSSGIFAIFVVFKSLSFSTIFALTYLCQDTTFQVLGYTFSTLSFIACCLFIGTIGKSAQLGLHTWLPDAMEGPTPVSALIHAATMVTAGVFLIIRCSPLLEYSSTVLFIITIVGALTAFFAGTVGMFQNDMKRVIAYSTCSQLGYMVFACGLSQYSLSLFHLMNHAFFKALLFLSAGVVIHALIDEQDMRRMGGLLPFMPLTYTVFFVGSFALMGFPFLTGFYSKDIILEIACSLYVIEGRFATLLGLLAAGCTAFYSIRLLLLVFFVEPRFPKPLLSSLHDVTFILSVPLIVLTLASIFVGYILKDSFIGLGTDFWNGSFIAANSAVFSTTLDVLSEFLSHYLKLLPLAISLAGMFGAFALYTSSFAKLGFMALNSTALSWYRFFSFKWYFDVLYNFFLARQILFLGYFVTFKALDRGSIELFGPTGVIRCYQFLSQKLKEVQTGYLHSYLILFIGYSFLLTAVTFFKVQSIFYFVFAAICLLGYLN